MELWKQINNLENYEVSNKGRVRNSKTGRIMKTSINARGYEIVQLHSGGKYFNVRIRRIVAEAFCDDYCDNLEVTNIDGDSLNSDAENLACRCRSDIIKNTYANGRKQTHRMKRIKCVETGETYDSIIECSRAMMISKESISKCVNNPALHTRDGYHFIPIK